MNASRTPGCYAPSYELVLNEYYYRRPMPIAWLLYHIASTRFGATSTTICQSDAAACHAPRGASAAIARAAAKTACPRRAAHVSFSRGRADGNNASGMDELLSIHGHST
jgi:hypothetical protein